MDRLIKKNRLPTIVAIVIICFMMYPIYFNQPNNADNQYTTVEIITAKYTTWQQTLPLTGTIAAMQHTKFIAEIPGILNKIADPTQQVESGELIAILESIPVNPPENLNHDPSKLIAPFAGIVGNYHMANGTLVSPGQTIVSLINPDSVAINLRVASVIAKQIMPQQKVLINHEIFYVQNIANKPDATTNLFTVTVNYRCDRCNPDDNVAVKLVMQEKPNVLLIPASAVFTVDDQSYIYVAEDNRAISRLVTIGMQSGEKLEITSGLQSGDLVIVSNTENLQNYSKIKIFENINQ